MWPAHTQAERALCLYWCLLPWYLVLAWPQDREGVFTVQELSLITTKTQVPSCCLFVCVSTLLEVIAYVKDRAGLGLLLPLGVDSWYHAWTRWIPSQPSLLAVNP